MLPPPIAYRSGLTAWAMKRLAWRIELVTSTDDAPLYLATDGARVCWVQDEREATTFETRDAAWDLVHAEQLAVSVRVRS